MGFRQQPQQTAESSNESDDHNSTNAHQMIVSYFEACKIPLFIDDKSRYNVYVGSTILTLEVARLDILAQTKGSNVVVRLWAHLAQEVPISAQLYRYLVTTNEDLLFGSFSAHDTGLGTANLYYTYALLGDYLHAETMETAISTIALAADDLDDYIVQTFGGHRASETIEQHG